MLNSATLNEYPTSVCVTNDSQLDTVLQEIKTQRRGSHPVIHSKFNKCPTDFSFITKFEFSFPTLLTPFRIMEMQNAFRYMHIQELNIHCTYKEPEFLRTISKLGCQAIDEVKILRILYHTPPIINTGHHPWNQPFWAEALDRFKNMRTLHLKTPVWLDDELLRVMELGYKSDESYLSFDESNVQCFEPDNLTQLCGIIDPDPLYVRHRVVAERLASQWGHPNHSNLRTIYLTCGYHYRDHRGLRSGLRGRVSRELFGRVIRWVYNFDDHEKEEPDFQKMAQDRRDN